MKKELKDLVGLHNLTGVDVSEESIKEEYGDSYENCSVLRFCLDGVVYVAIEDPNDGYRSCMRQLKTSRKKIKNSFPAVSVIGIYKTESSWGNSSDILILYNCSNGQKILEVGTENTDDYYPSFVAHFNPEAIGLTSTQP